MTFMNTGSMEPMVFASSGLLEKTVPEMLEYTVYAHHRGNHFKAVQTAGEMKILAGLIGKGVVPKV